jgi:putative phosphoesterase
MTGTRIAVGIISDTHGLLRPEAVAALDGSDLIVHAGDVGAPDVLERLGSLAPTFSVRGNVDTAAWAMSLPMTDVVDALGVQLYVLHDLSALDLDPRAAGFAADCSGVS